MVSHNCFLAKASLSSIWLDCCNVLYIIIVIVNEAGSVGNAVRKGVHPVVKKFARKIIKKTAETFDREYVSGQIEDFAYGGIYEFTSFYTISVVRSYRRR